MQEQHTSQTSWEQPENRPADEQIDRQRQNLLLNRLRSEQNLRAGFAAGLTAAVAGGVFVAMVTYASTYRIGLITMALGMGFLVGYAVRIAGQGVDRSFGFIGAGLSIVGCVLGDLLMLSAELGKQEGISFISILTQLDFATADKILRNMPINLFFYGIVVYEGYKFSFRKFTEDEPYMTEV